MQIPTIRRPQILEGPRGSGVGNPDKNFRLLTDLNHIAPAKGEFVFLSQSSDYRVLLRGAKSIKDRDGRVIGEIDPLEVQFSSGMFRTTDETTAELLEKNPDRGRRFFTHGDVVGMKDKADEKQLQEFLSVASPEVKEKLRMVVSDKSFNLGSKPKN